MSFLAPLLLALSAFASIPILLHLIRRRRVRVLELPTFQYLRRVAEQQRVRFRFQDQFLMLLRILILVLLALAFAGPLGGERSPTAEGPMVKQRNLLILDDTLSMGAPIRSGGSAYDAARRFVLKLLWESGVEWEVGMASDFLGQLPPEEFIANGYEETLDLFDRRPSPEGRGSLSEALQKARSLVSNEIALWTVTDAAASNWDFAGDPVGTPEGVVELIRVETPESANNWAVTELTLNNQPLLENEPALLTGRFEYFGDGPVPIEPPTVLYGWRSASGESKVEQYQPSITDASADAAESAEAPSSWTVQYAVSSVGRITSVSAALMVPAGGMDALPADNRLTRIPLFLEGVRILVAAETEAWAKTVRAALVGFDCELASSLEPPNARAGAFSGYVILLEKEPPHPEWRSLLEERVRSGSGLLVLYDFPPDAVRVENWGEWWGSWGMTMTPVPQIQPMARMAPGVVGSFHASLDPTALETEWASEGYGGAFMEGWESELDAVSVLDERSPLFQTRTEGDGTVAVWTPALSPRSTPLLYSPAWAPLISQMVKRTLSENGTIDAVGREGDSAIESRLAGLSEEQRLRLSEQGYRIHSLDRVEPKVGDLEQVRRNWTALILLIGLVLALIEIGVSNYV